MTDIFQPRFDFNLEGANSGAVSGATNIINKPQEEGGGPPPVNPDVTPDWWNLSEDSANTIWTGSFWQMGFVGAITLKVDGTENPDWWVGFRPSQVTIEWNDGTSGVVANIPVQVFDSSDLISEVFETSTTTDEENFTTIVPLDFTGHGDIDRIRVGINSDSSIADIEITSITFA